MRSVRGWAVALAVVSLLRPLQARAQQPVTREQAVASALSRGARAALGRADTAAARGAARAARAVPNPLFSASYTKAVPLYHTAIELPLDLPWLRGPRIGVAEAAREAARYSFAFERAAIRFEVETTYTRALASAARARLSRRNALDADSLLSMARLRREVGDVSELDVRLAAVSAGQLENTAADDSLAAMVALLTLQLAMGLPGETVTIALADSLVAPADTTIVPAPTREPLPVLAATAALRSGERAVALARGSLFAPSLSLGVENGDPTGAERGLLPTVGLSFPLPLFNWNGGAIALASAQRDRARAELDRVRRETDAGIAQTRRALAVAMARVRRDAGLLESANLVAAMSLQAYGEGAVALPNVLEAQRNARDVLGRYLDDLAAADSAAAALRLFTAAAEEP